MVSIKNILSFFDTGYLKKSLLLLLTLALLPFFDLLLVLYLSELLGTYLILATIAATALLGSVLSYMVLRKFTVIIKNRVKEDTLPEKEFLSFAAAIPGSLFLILPGFIMTILGLLLFLPGFREKAGWWFLKATGIQIKEVYGYLKLYE